jgi:hypothetical protein
MPHARPSTTTTIPGPRPRWLSARALLWGTAGTLILAHVGAHVDAWVHVHRGFAVESFWTWSHALLYAGKAATVALLAAYGVESWHRGEPRARWLPPGYRLVGLGVWLFAVGGVFDLGWHAWVGVEATIEALLSPAHLWLVAAAWLGALGLLRAALAAHRPAAVVVSLALLYRITTWSLFYADPSAVDYAAGGVAVGDLPAFAGLPWANSAATIAGVTGMVLAAVVFAVFLVGPLRYLGLPPGSVAALLLWNALFAGTVSGLWWSVVPAAAAAGAGEALAAGIRRGGLGGPAGAAGYWALGFTVPAVQVALTVGVIAAVGGGLRWTTHLWAGSPLLAGAFGLVVALLVCPPRWLRAR